MLSSFDGELPGGVVVNDFGDAVEWGAVLTQNILLFGFGQFHVHEALVAPANRNRSDQRLPTDPDQGGLGGWKAMPYPLNMQGTVSL